MLISIFKNFQPIAAALAPNYTFWDCLIAGKYLLFPWNWKKLQKGKNSEKLEIKFKKYIGLKHAISFDSGRSGFYAILKCLGVKDYDEVILQAFTTVALPNIILWCGAKPVYADIDERTYNVNADKIEEKITGKTKAIVIQHTFGNPADMDRIMEIAKKHNLFVIEDCAHSLGAEYKGKKTGTFGDAAFFSFGRDKVISSVSGGMVVTDDNELGKRIAEFKNRMPYPEKSLVTRQLLHVVITYKALRTYYFAGIGKILMYVLTKFGILTKAYTAEEKSNKKPKNFPARMPNALAEIALHQLKLIDKFNKHRIAISEIYSKKLSGDEDIGLPKSTENSKNIFLWYTILAESKKELIKKAKKEHIILGDWFPQAVGPIEVNLEKSGYEKGMCPVAEKVSLMCVNLPTNKNVDEKDAERVVGIVKE